MSEWWMSLSNSLRVFYVIGIASTLILVIQLILNLIGLAGSDMDVDAAGDVDIPGDVGIDHPDLAQHSSGLGLISIRTVIAFFVGFGWTGVMMLTAGRTLLVSVLVAFVVGVVFLLVVFYLMRMIFRLSESGNVDYRNAVGRTGTVYLPIPGQNRGAGQIQLVVQGRLRQTAAVTDGQEDLPVGTTVQVAKVVASSTMLVRKLEA